MTITVQQFRADYPEFTSTSTYPNGQVQYWFNVAYKLLNACRWGDMLDVAAELYTAHNLALEAKAQLEAANGGVPGSQVGPVSSQSADKASVSFDTGAGAEAGAGHWNLTIYGTRLYRLIKLFGAGPLQIGIGYDPTGGLNGPAWPGPDTTPGFTNFGT